MTCFILHHTAAYWKTVLLPNTHRGIAYILIKAPVVYVNALVHFSVTKAEGVAESHDNHLTLTHMLMVRFKPRQGAKPKMGP